MAAARAHFRQRHRRARAPLQPRSRNLHPKPAVKPAVRPALKPSHNPPGTPVALLGYQVSVEGRRPSFPGTTPAAYSSLAKACWAANPQDRCGPAGARQRERFARAGRPF
jgi:hypothetical protein